MKNSLKSMIIQLNFLKKRDITNDEGFDYQVMEQLVIRFYLEFGKIQNINKT